MVLTRKQRATKFEYVCPHCDKVYRNKMSAWNHGFQFKVIVVARHTGEIKNCRFFSFD